MTTIDPSANYLHDLGREVLILARKAKLDAATSADPFSKGRQTALYEVLSLMREQAATFGLDEAAIGLKGVNIEELLK